MTRKRCPACREEKDPDAFGTRRVASGNVVLRSRCRSCERETGRRDYAANRDARRARAAQRRRENPERYAEYDRRARAKQDPAQRAATRRAHYVANRDAARAYSRAWRQANPERRAAAQAAYMRRLRERDIDRARALVAERERRRRARRGAQTAPFTTEQLLARLSMWPGCWRCGADATEVDHVKPLAKGGAHMLCNLRPICRACNARKADQWPIR